MFMYCIYVARLEGTTRVAFVRNDQELFLCLTEPVPDSCKIDPSVGKAEPTSNAGSISLLMYWWKGENAVRKSSYKKCEGNNSADLRSVKEGVEEVLQVPE